MTPNQSHVAGLELAMNEMAEHSPAACALAHYHLRPLIDQAKSAPAEPVSREAVGVLCVSHFRGSAAMENVEYQALKNLPEGQRFLFTAPPSPDAELVELLSWLRRSINCTPENDVDKCGAWISTKHPMIQRIDAKLASLK